MKIKYCGNWYEVRWYDPIHGEYRIVINGEQRNIRKTWVEEVTS